MEQITTDCNKCEQVLNEKKIVYLAYDRENDTFYSRENPPKDWDGEMFPFGSACANKVLKNDGKI